MPTRVGYRTVNQLHTADMLSSSFVTRGSTDPIRAEKAQRVPIECFFCDEKTVARVIAVADMHSPDTGWNNRTILYFARCEQCEDPVLVKREAPEGPNEKGQYPLWSPIERLWPSGEEEWINEAIPAGLRNELTQARICLKVNAFTAAVVMVRRILEGVAIDHGITRGPLASRLQELSRQGHIDGQLVEWTNALRILGNEGAHYTGNSVAHQDAQDALTLAEALLDYVYVFSKQFKAFMGRRTQQSPP